MALLGLTAMSTNTASPKHRAENLARELSDVSSVTHAETGIAEGTVRFSNRHDTLNASVLRLLAEHNASLAVAGKSLPCDWLAVV